jgi:phosphoribulokinase
MRFGYTLLGAKTKFMSPGAQGLEIDFFSSQAMDLHFAETAEKMIADAGPLVGKTLQYVHDDSYEVVSPDGTQPTWTP